MRDPVSLVVALVLCAASLALADPVTAFAEAPMADRARQLRIAAGNGNAPAVMTLLDGGVTVDFADEYGLTPLMAAAFSGHTGVVHLLLERGADPFLTHASGQTALDYAKGNGHRDVTWILGDKMGLPDPLAPQRATPTSRPQPTLMPQPQGEAVAKREDAAAAPVRSEPKRAGLQRTGGPVALGVYACRDAGAGGDRRPEDYGSFQGGGFTTTRFEITGAGSYTYRGTNRTPGSFEYAPATGAIRFTAGPFAATETATVVGEYGLRADGKPALHLTYRFPDGRSLVEFCAPMTR